MTNSKDTPQANSPEEKLLLKGADALTKSELLAVLLGSGPKGVDVQRLAQQLVRKFNKNFLQLAVDDLTAIPGIGATKALQIVAAIALVKKFYAEDLTEPATEAMINRLKEAAALARELRVNRKDLSRVASGMQEVLFDMLEIERPAYEVDAAQINETYVHVPQFKKNHFQLHNRRYIGNKYKLIDWIFSVINAECKDCKTGKDSSFLDIFAGTGVVAAVASQHFAKVIVNDFLFSNETIYKAFLGAEPWDAKKVQLLIKEYNNLSGEDLADNYFSRNFGGKYFSRNSARLIGFIRANIEANRKHLSEREYHMLICSLLYSTDKIANTVGHYDAYFKKGHIEDRFFMRPIDPITTGNVSIFREDANLLAGKVKADIVYIDPPYNSRQYSRFYHVLETLTKWDQPDLYGVALKPRAENMSDYCRAGAKDRFAELVGDLQAKNLVVSYNNTYAAKSNSSRNRITLEDLQSLLSKRGKTRVFEKDYRHFNAGNTDFKNHKEYLFVTRVSS